MLPIFTFTLEPASAVPVSIGVELLVTLGPVNVGASGGVDIPVAVVKTALGTSMAV